MLGPPQSVLGLAYCGSAYCKLRDGGLGWADGRTLQGILMAKHLEADRPLGRWGL